jgi:hypothetical protein
MDTERHDVTEYSLHISEKFLRDSLTQFISKVRHHDANWLPRNL